jgi:hypothetical protein
MASPCGDPKCRAYRLTVKEFEQLGGEQWTQSFRIRVGLRARELFVKLYRRKPDRVRSSPKARHKNTVGNYPCGILEQAYRELKTESAEPMTLPAGDTASTPR